MVHGTLETVVFSDVQFLLSYYGSYGLSMYPNHKINILETDKITFIYIN